MSENRFIPVQVVADAGQLNRLIHEGMDEFDGYIVVPHR
jgi:hypothetical protein